MGKWTASELMEQSPQYFAADRAMGLNARVGVVLSGPGGGEWTYMIANGQLTVIAGLAEPLDGSMYLTAEDWVALHEGTLKAAQAYQNHRIRMEGDPKLLRQVGELFEHDEDEVD